MRIFTHEFNNSIDIDGWDISAFCFDSIGRRSYYKDRNGHNFEDVLELYWDDWGYDVKRKR